MANDNDQPASFSPTRYGLDDIVVKIVSGRTIEHNGQRFDPIEILGKAKLGETKRDYALTMLLDSLSDHASEVIEERIQFDTKAMRIIGALHQLGATKDEIKDNLNNVPLRKAVQEQLERMDKIETGKMMHPAEAKLLDALKSGETITLPPGAFAFVKPGNQGKLK